MERSDGSLWLLKVTIHEILPNYGRCWTNVYSTGKSDWMGWKESGADSGSPFKNVHHQTLNGLTGHSNYENKGHISLLLKTMPYSGTFSVGVYGSNNPDELSHGSNVTALGTFEIKTAQIGVTQVINTGSTYKYIITYPVYKSGWTSGTGAIAEIKVY